MTAICSAYDTVVGRSSGERSRKVPSLPHGPWTSAQHSNPDISCTAHEISGSAASRTGLVCLGIRVESGVSLRMGCLVYSLNFDLDNLFSAGGTSTDRIISRPHYSSF